MSRTTVSWSQQEGTNISSVTPSVFYNADISAAYTKQFLGSLSYSNSSDFAVTTNSPVQEAADVIQEPPYSIFQMILIVIVAGALSILTVVGNILVMLSFKLDRKLRTIGNYFLLSLSVADFLIGLISMPLFTMYLLMGYWPLSDFICDSWLAFDYLISNASVLNLLIISFDRYFSVTRPLTYRALRSTKRAAFMIASAWVISLVLWPPWIYAWPYIEGARTVKKNHCYIQFLETNSYVTFGTAIAAFYVPVTVMICLYWRIWRETMQRQKDLRYLQGGRKEDTRISTSSASPTETKECRKPKESKRVRNESQAVPEKQETTYVPTILSAETSKYYPQTRKPSTRTFLKDLLLSFKVDSDVDPPDEDDDEDDDDENHSSPVTPADTPSSLETPMQSCSRTASMSFRNDHLVQVHSPHSFSLPPISRKKEDNAIPMTERNGPKKPKTEIFESKRHSSNYDLHTKSLSSPVADSPHALSLSQVPQNVSQSISALNPLNPESIQPAFSHLSAPSRLADSSSMYSAESVYTVFIHIPEKASATQREGQCQASIKMIMEKGEGNLEGVSPEHADVKKSSDAVKSSSAGNRCKTSLRPTDPSIDTLRLPLSTKMVHKQVVKDVAPKKKHKQQEKKQDMKAAKTLCLILFVFIITWTPYNILVLIKTLLSDGKNDDFIPVGLWNFSYYFCYINSTINPVCYALCNVTFKRTYMRILRCQWYKR